MDEAAAAVSIAAGRGACCSASAWSDSSSRRNMIVMFLAAEMMLQGVSVSLVAWGRYHNDWGGQVLVIFILTVAACEAAIALALVLMLYQRNGKLDIDAWHELRESNLPPYTDAELPEVRRAAPPRLAASDARRGSNRRSRRQRNRAPQPCLTRAP